MLVLDFYDFNFSQKIEKNQLRGAVEIEARPTSCAQELGLPLPAPSEQRHRWELMSHVSQVDPTNLVIPVQDDDVVGNGSINGY